MAQSKDYLDPRVLSRISNYELLAKTVVEGFISGFHRSLFQGFGSEFVQYRNYARGDDLKYMDWKVYARRDELQMKVFREETNTNCYVVLDASNSMAYGGGEEGDVSKLHYGKMLAACIAHLAARQGENVGFYAFNSDVVSSIKPGHRSGQVHAIHTELARIQPGGAANYDKILSYLGDQFSRRGIVIFISDFLDADEAFFRGLRRFRHSHHDCLLFHVVHDDEINFNFERMIRFIDSETAEEIVTAPEAIRQQYLTAFAEHLKRVSSFCLTNGLDAERLQTSQSLGDALAAVMHRRKATS
jgi:uncharacterized protein (DUF58 family)